jgi:hypothetical protein
MPRRRSARLGMDGDDGQLELHEVGAVQSACFVQSALAEWSVLLVMTDVPLC